MYCIKCGVRLGDAETACPLCGTRVYHPELPMPHGTPPYPGWEGREFQPNPSGIQFIFTAATLLIAALCLIIDISIHRTVTWSGYAAGGIGLVYTVIILPAWFHQPNPVIFVPIDFVALNLYLLYISLTTHGGWYLSFAFPVVSIFGLLVETVVVLCRYLRHGHLYVFSGAFLFLGCSMMLLELFQVITFGGKMFYWSLYPLGVFSAVGIFLLLVAIIRPLKRAMHKLFFL